MRIRITRPIVADMNTTSNVYLVARMHIPLVVFNGTNIIYVVEHMEGAHGLNVFYKGHGYTAEIPKCAADQAAALAKPFFEAVKAGHDSFEVQ